MDIEQETQKLNQEFLETIAFSSTNSMDWSKVETGKPLIH